MQSPFMSLVVGMAVTALAKTKSLIIQADEKMKGEIVDLLHRLDVREQRR